MTLESIEAIINRTKGRSGWFIEGFGAEDAVRQLAPEFELLVAEIERLRTALYEAQQKADDEANIVGDELHALSKDARRSHAWMSIWHKRARAWEQQLTANRIEPRDALEIDADAEFVP